MMNPFDNIFMSEDHTDLIVEEASDSLNSSSILNDLKNDETPDSREEILIKPITEWDEEDILRWATSISIKRKCSILNSNVSCFSQHELTGKILYDMNLNDFMALHTNKEAANIFYDELQRLKEIQQCLHDKMPKTEVLLTPSDDLATTANCSQKLQPTPPMSNGKRGKQYPALQGYIMMNPFDNIFMSEDHTDLIVEEASDSLNSSSILNDLKNDETPDSREEILIKPITEWDEEDILRWATSISIKRKCSILNSNVSCFSQHELTGKILYDMNLNDFMALHTNKEAANIFYDELQRLKEIQQCLHDKMPKTEVLLTPSDDLATTANCSQKLQPTPPMSNGKRESRKKIGRLWEFYADLLYNGEYNPRIIHWENFEEGTFKLLNYNEIARLWGVKKRRNNMNCEKMFREMRCRYYHKKLLVPIPKKLVYQFGENAKGWKRLSSFKKL